MPAYSLTLRVDFTAEGETEAYRTFGNVHSIANFQRLLKGMDQYRITYCILKKRGRRRPLCALRSRT